MTNWRRDEQTHEPAAQTGWITPRSTFYSLLALLAGFAVGAVSGPRSSASALFGVLAGAGSLWVNALRMLALPLAVGNIVCALAPEKNTRAARPIAGSIAIYLAFLLLGASLVLAIVPPALGFLHVDRTDITALSKATPLPAQKSNSEARREPGLSELITGLIPRNVLQSAVNEEYLRVIVFAILFALALRAAGSDNSRTVTRFAQGVTEALMILVRWVIWCSPPAMFAIAATFAVNSGGVALGILGRFVLLECLLLLGFVLLLYPITALVGGVSLRRFARCAVGPQMVAVTTRSSLAALPALLAAGDEMLPDNPETSRTLIPIAVSIFKVNRTVSALCRLLVIVYYWSVPSGGARITTFLLTVILLSFSDLGLPGGSQLRTLPAYLAAGCPIEAVMLLEVFEPFSDICKTLVNVTGDLSIAAIATRWSGRPVRDRERVPVESAAI